MNEKQAAKKGPKLPTAGLPKLVVMIIGGVFGLFVVIILYGLIAGRGSSNTDLYVGAMARGQEIVRVSTSVGTLATDEQTQNLAATTQTTLSSQISQITAYLATQKFKVGSSSLGVDKDSTTDTQMQTASTNGSLASTYDSYLKTQLAKYQTDLQNAKKGAGPRGLGILQNAIASVQVILSSSQLAGAS